MRDQRWTEIVLLAVVGAIAATGGRVLLALLHRNVTVGALIAAGAVVAALASLRRAYRPDRPDARIAATKYGAYLCASLLGLWAVIGPARWNVGATIAMVVVAVAFDIVTVWTRPRAQGG